MEKQNVTLSLPKSLLREAKILAVERETFLSQLLVGTGVKSLILSVPSEGPHALAGGSPARVTVGSPVAWMAGGDGNLAF